jgi:hypothetical protein
VANVADFEQAIGEAFTQHPDAATITSFPGSSTVLEARILAEIGDDRTASATPKRSSFHRHRAGHPNLADSTLGHHAGGPQPPTVPRDHLWALPRLTRSPESPGRLRPAPPARGAYSAAVRHSPTASSGSCITASTSASATTKPRPSHPTSKSQLDTYRMCDVCPLMGVTRHSCAAR